ncbi:hypothetical protein FOA19_20460 [Rufibacter hautae]|uniref:Uncharacterized protein n=1 Tax=Rufibacter hautae TaxID=2595005 RepID=A0A5B6TCC6_9BACT|nr:hypothetical protein FOA19_20460 [Rufibacter hautae]
MDNHDFDLSPEEEVSLSGYKGKTVDADIVKAIMGKRALKGIDATSNIYKFSGLYLASKVNLKEHLKNKYQISDLLQKYFLTKVEPALLDILRGELDKHSDDIALCSIKRVLDCGNVLEAELDASIDGLTNNGYDVKTQILLEDLEKTLLRVKYVNKSSDDIVRDVLYNFSNAIQKIIKDRRKGHAAFNIMDEYDVQDILYVILKSIFPNLRDEDPIPKVGAKSTKIDLILREERILIEVKMIKQGDSNETHFIEQLKVDFESYHECKWLDKLFCFVYDPYKKTKDISNFNDLNGSRVKGDHGYNVEVIVRN